jgi:hypothetical protein
LAKNNYFIDLQWPKACENLCCIQGRHFEQNFSYIVAVTFIGGGNQSTQRKPQTYRKGLTKEPVLPRGNFCIDRKL